MIIYDPRNWHRDGAFLSKTAYTGDDTAVSESWGLRKVAAGGQAVLGRGHAYVWGLGTAHTCVCVCDAHALKPARTSHVSPRQAAGDAAQVSQGSTSACATKCLRGDPETTPRGDSPWTEHFGNGRTSSSSHPPLT